MSKARDIAKILGVTEDNNPNSSRILFAGETLDSAEVTALAAVVSPTLTVYDSINELPVTSLVSGTQTYVRSNKKLYITLDNAYYNIATVNLTPTVTLDPSGTIVLSDSGQPSAIVTINATDSDGADANLVYSVESDGNMLGRATLTQDSSVFTIDPLSSDSGATTGTFTLTFKANDGVNIGTATKDFSLTFAAGVGVDSSSATVLLVKALGAADNNDDIGYQNGSDIQLDTVGFTNSGTPQATFFSPYRRGGYSTYFDGSGDYISFPSTSTTVPGASTDFSIEFWLNTLDNSDWTIFDNTGAGGNMQISKISNTYYVHYLTAGDGWSMAVSNNEWHHWAIIHSSSNDTTKVYVDGTVVKTLTGRTQSFGSLSTNNIGRRNDGYYPLKGYLRDFRFVLGSQVYTSDFTPPTEPLTAISGTSVLACHLPYIADGSTNNHTFTVNGNAHTVPFGPYDYDPHITLSQSGYDSDIGSTYFNGSSYVYASALGSEYTFGSGDFTVEAWYWPTTLSSGADAVVTTADTTDRQGIWMGVNNDKMFVLTGEGTVWLSATSTASLVLNQWNHMAAVRNGNTVYGYLNGAQVLSYSESRTLTNSNNAIRIGGRSVASQRSNGYISDVRVIKGTAQYTSAFTPPFSRLQWVTNTVLQVQNVLDPRIYDVTSSNGVLAFGNAQTNTSTRKFTTSSSIYLDGSGDYLVVPRTETSWIGDGSDFTIEAWVYKSNSPSLWTIYSQWAQIVGGYEQFILAGTSTWDFYWRPFGNSGAMLASSTATSLNTWTHIAVTRQGDLFTLWVNGTSEDTYSTPLTDLAYSSANIPQAIGTYYDTGGQPGAGGYAQGYIQDLRVSKGKARYTANFTAPTAEFEL